MPYRLVFLLTLVLLSISPISAQTLPPEDEFIRDRSARAKHFNIVYLVDRTTELDEAISIERIAEYFHTQPLDSWEDVLLYDDLLAIEAMIIHSSALPFIDQEWTAEAYKRGVIFAAFDLPSQDFAEVVGVPRLEKRYVLVPEENTFIRVYAYGGAAGDGVGILSRLDERLALIDGIVRDLESVREQKQDFLRDLF
jgi:hypothetical protein